MYNKLFTKILDSSIWLEPEATRLVWITFIASMDEDGFATFAAVENLARRANVSTDEARAAVMTLEAPDPNSSNPAKEGRRIERIPGGWIIINASLYRDLVTRAVAKERNRERVARFREKKKAGNALCNGQVTPSEAVSEAEAEAEASRESARAAPAAPKSEPKNSVVTLPPIVEKPQDLGQAVHPADFATLSDRDLLRMAGPSIKTWTNDADKRQENEHSTILLLRHYGRRAIEVAEAMRFDKSREKQGKPWPEEVEQALAVTTAQEKTTDAPQGSQTPATSQNDPYSKVMERIIADRGWHACAAALEMPIKSAEVLRETLTDNRALGEILIDKLGEPSDAKYLEDATT